MLYTNIREADKYNYLNDSFCAAYRWLRETDLAKIEPGEYQILGTKVRAMVMEYQTVSEQEARLEAHEKFFDIQYMISGEERFGISLAKDAVETERIPEKDLIFYEDPQDLSYVVLKAGEMAVVAPEDLHKPKVSVAAAAAVKKVVIKVAL